jgi:hypothetical protein
MSKKNYENNKKLYEGFQDQLSNLQNLLNKYTLWDDVLGKESVADSDFLLAFEKDTHQKLSSRDSVINYLNTKIKTYKNALNNSEKVMNNSLDYFNKEKEKLKKNAELASFI